jgi:predicted RNA binding protein YcfA (HicA-like mRNA interferase family)
LPERAETIDLVWSPRRSLARLNARCSSFPAGPRRAGAYENVVPVKVREAIRQVEAAGWTLARTRGSHRQYRHPSRSGLVTIAGKPSASLHPKTWASIMKQAGIKEP